MGNDSVPMQHNGASSAAGRRQLGVSSYSYNASSQQRHRYNAQGSSGTGGRERHYGQPASAEASQYSRDRYSSGSHSRKSVSHPQVKHQKNRRRGKVIALVIAGVVVIAAIVFIFFWTRPIQITVDGAKKTVAFNSTYDKLHDDGVLDAVNGDLLAVDGSVLKQAGGNEYKVYDNGTEVENHNARVHNDAVLTEAKGDDVTEDAAYTDSTTAWTWDIEDCGRQDTYNFSIGMYVTQGTDGVETTAKGKTSGKTAEYASQTMVPRMIRHYFTNKTGGQKTIALTFDDGPSTYTQQILDVLSKYGAVGTFYEVGNNIQEYPDASKAVIAQGSEIGNHSLTHNNYYNADNSSVVLSEVSQTNQIIKDTTGETCTNIRPPGGFWSDSLWKTLDGQCTLCVGWSIDTEDWKKPGVDSIVNTALEQAAAGDVVLMHDGGGDRSQSVAALDKICSTLKERGYTFVTVSQMADTERSVLVSSGAIPQG